jgi:hypothetical protein
VCGRLAQTTQHTVPCCTHEQPCLIPNLPTIPCPACPTVHSALAMYVMSLLLRHGLSVWQTAPSRSARCALLHARTAPTTTHHALHPHTCDACDVSVAEAWVECEADCPQSLRTLCPAAHLHIPFTTPTSSHPRTCDVSDISVAKSWVECVADCPQAHDAIPGLKVPRGVPRKRTHHVTKPVAMHACACAGQTGDVKT